MQRAAWGRINLVHERTCLSLDCYLRVLPPKPSEGLPISPTRAGQVSFMGSNALMNTKYNNWIVNCVWEKRSHSEISQEFCGIICGVQFITTRSQIKQATTTSTLLLYVLHFSHTAHTPPHHTHNTIITSHSTAGQCRIRQTTMMMMASVRSLPSRTHCPSI